MAFLGGHRRWQGAGQSWVRRHSLGLAVLSLFIVLHVGSYLTQQWAEAQDTRLVWLNTTLHGLRDDAFGAVVLVYLSKWFFEQGSAESASQ